MRRMLLASVIVLAAIPALAQDPGWIGIQIEDQKQDRGAVVRRVEPNSPGEKSGLKEGDVIVEFDKQEVVGVQQLTRLVRETPVGRTVDVKIRRANQEQTLKITMDRGAALSLRGDQFQLSMPNVHILADRLGRDFPRVEVNTTFVQSGMRVQQLTDQLRDFFGVSGDGGVLVSSVDSGSAAEKAGVKAGDVITAIDGRNIRTPADFGREMRADSKPMLKVFRDKKERELRIE
jgi:serine protease Do